MDIGDIKGGVWCHGACILCGLLLCDSSPICKKVLVVSLHTFTLMMMIQNAQWTMRLLYSIKLFLTYISMWMNVDLTSSMPQQRFKLQISLNYAVIPDNVVSKKLF